MAKNMRIGYLTRYSKEEAEWACRNGFRSLQLLIWPGDPLDPSIASEREIGEVFEHLSGLDIEVSALGYYPNHLAPDPKERGEANDHLLRLMEMAAKMNVPVVGTFAGRDPEKSVEENIPDFKDVFTPIADKAETLGVKIGFENCPMFKNHPFRGINIAFTPNAWDLMFEAVPSKAIGLEYDPSHLVCQMIDYIEVIHEYGDRIVHVHAKDAEVIPWKLRRNGIFEKGTFRHRTPGFGDVDWKKVVSALAEIGYRGNLDIEGLHDEVFKDDREREGLLLSLKHLDQFVVHEYR
ncbi:sugar phosphate isomerase/epimerase family protein [Effusibacillus consociatus]|uniref:Sugar phosphate isomerase/epimerase family protein n=1 Tax=Effusibacillus consociatus TaxID=1117041 RepID=A0ABV9Q825_9BACL